VRGAAAWALALTAAVSGTAHAYCRTSTCSSCARDAQTGCSLGGTPIAWPNACVSFSMQEAASSAIDLEHATALMREAFAIWENARCGEAGERPSIQISDAFGPALCATTQYNTRAGNANLVLFRDDDWPYSGEGRELAATWLTVDGQGVILDADIEINATSPLSVPAEAGLSLGVIVDQHDLLSIMVHEAGHFLGLDHSREDGSVMLAELSAAEVRTQLSADDEAAICAAYPPERDAATCDYTPRGGFAPECAANAAASGCSVELPGRSGGGTLVAAALVSCVWLVRKRRRP
jgi:hypothetical protein